MNLKIRHLSKLYDCIYALNDISLDIFSGEFVTIMGESGSGKSTFLKVLSRLTDRSSGDIYYDDIDIDCLTDLNVSYIFQDNVLYPNKTVFENIYLSKKTDNSYDEAKNEILSILQLFKIDNLASVYPYQLSVGQMQKVSLAKIYYKKSQLILLDEPMSHLDEVSKKEMSYYLLYLRKLLPTSTFICVTHELPVSLAYSNRYIFINNGSIVNDVTKSYLSLYKGDYYSLLSTNIYPNTLSFTCEIKNNTITILGNQYNIDNISHRLLDLPLSATCVLNQTFFRKHMESNDFSVDFEVEENNGNSITISSLDNSLVFTLYKVTSLKESDIIRLYYSFDDLILFSDNRRITSAYSLSNNKIDLNSACKLSKRLHKDGFNYVFIPFDAFFINSISDVSITVNKVYYEEQFEDYKIIYCKSISFDDIIAIKMSKELTYINKRNMHLFIDSSKIYYY